MARGSVRHLPPGGCSESDDALSPREIKRQEFGRRLAALLTERGWNQSELARRSEIGRDAVSTYIRGRVFPENKSLAAMAKALSVEPEQLLPNATMQAMDYETPALEIREASGHPGMCWLRVSRKVTSAQALKIMQILNEDGE